jgi:hypothetical protein
VLAPGEAAWFDVGTIAAYQGGAHPITVDRLVLRLPGSPGPLSVGTRMVATRPPGAPIPFRETALRRAG